MTQTQMLAYYRTKIAEYEDAAWKVAPGAQARRLQKIADRYRKDMEALQPPF